MIEYRFKLKTILAFIHPGETLVVTRVDRLPRSMKNRDPVEREGRLSRRDGGILDTPRSGRQSLLRQARRLC